MCNAIGSTVTPAHSEEPPFAMAILQAEAKPARSLARRQGDDSGCRRRSRPLPGHARLVHGERHSLAQPAQGAWGKKDNPVIGPVAGDGEGSRVARHVHFRDRLDAFQLLASELAEDER